MKIFKVKRVTAIVITFALILGLISTSFASAQSSEQSKDQVTGAKVVAEQERIIHALEKYVSVNSDGTFLLNAPKNVIADVGDENYSNVIKHLKETNNLIKSGKFKTTKNGTIYEATDESLVIQGGGVDSFTSYWWGYVRYASYNEANRIAAGFSKISTGAWAVTTAGGLLCLTPAVAVGVGATLGGLYNAVMFGWMSTDISYYNSLSDRGIILTMYFSVAYKVECQ